jgi:hypothetical protein
MTSDLTSTFAFLPLPLSIPVAVAVFGVIVLGGMQLPVVTSGSGVRRWLPWVLWFLALMACPVAMVVVRWVCESHEPPIRDDWVDRVLARLGVAHLGVSAIASLAVVVLTRGVYRLLAWAAILAIDAVGFVVFIVVFAQGKRLVP